MSELTKQIAIIGGGFGGLYTALRLAEMPWENPAPDIYLIDQNDRFVFSPLLYELITGEMQSWEIAPPYQELLADTPIKFIQKRVTEIDIPAQKVLGLEYDLLVLGVGVTTPKDMVPGAQEYALPFRNLEDAYKLLDKLRELERTDSDKIRIAVVGGGYSGVEIACKLSDRLGEKGRIRVIDQGETLLKATSEHNQKAARKALESRKIWVDLETEVTQVQQDTLSLQYKGQIDIIPVDVVIWTVGNLVPQLIQNLSLPSNSKGLLLTNSYLQLLEHPNIYALGDIAQAQGVDNQNLYSTAQVALQQADYCAWNIWATINNRPLLPFRYYHLGDMMTLGIGSATMSGLGISLEGPLAHLARRLVYLYRMPTFKHQVSVGLNWITQPILEILA